MACLVTSGGVNLKTNRCPRNGQCSMSGQYFYNGQPVNATFCTNCEPRQERPEHGNSRPSHCPLPIDTRTWTNEQWREFIEASIQRGCRSFYIPEPL